MFAAILLQRVPTLWPIAFALVPVYPWTVYVSGFVLGWRFGRGRLVLSLLVLLAADQTLLAWAPAHSYPLGASRAVYDVVALLLPLNVVALAWVPERGLLTVPARLMALAVALEALLVFGFNHPRMAPLIAWIDYPFIDAPLGATPQLGLLVFLAGLGVLGLRFLRRPMPTEAGAVWAVVAALVGISAGGGGIASSISFATGGLVLIVSFIETSHGMAYSDDLTGLPARRALNEALTGLTGTFTIAMVDIDHFKRFNDQTPQLEALRQMIEVTSFTLRGADRPRRKPETPRPSDEAPRARVSVTVSIGIAEAERGRWTPDEVIRAADEALYRAKHAGRNRIRA